MERRLIRRGKPQGRLTQLQRKELEDVLSHALLERCTYEFDARQCAYLEMWVVKPLEDLLASFDGKLPERRQVIPGRLV
jgi:hypothetical protein